MMCCRCACRHIRNLKWNSLRSALHTSGQQITDGLKTTTVRGSLTVCCYCMCVSKKPVFFCFENPLHLQSLESFIAAPIIATSSRMFSSVCKPRTACVFCYFGISFGKQNWAYCMLQCPLACVFLNERQTNVQSYLLQNLAWASINDGLCQITHVDYI